MRTSKDSLMDCFEKVNIKGKKLWMQSTYFEHGVH